MNVHVRSRGIPFLAAREGTRRAGVYSKPSLSAGGKVRQENNGQRRDKPDLPVRQGLALHGLDLIRERLAGKCGFFFLLLGMSND